MMGYFYPPTDGDYVFYLCSDDNSQLFLSTDDNPNNKLLIAAETMWSAPRYYTTSDGPSDIVAGGLDVWGATDVSGNCLPSEGK
jgi:hypothetical protein